ncbi:MAG: flagellar basal body rod protein FlgB [Candidatus Deferrimicrobiaceae bacterium]
MNILYDPAIQLLQKVADYRAARQEVVASNIANTETPGYIARDVPFEAYLSRAESGGSAGPRATHPRHIGGSAAGSGPILPPLESEGDAVRVDGNNVILEKEMTKSAENTVGYMTAMTLIARKMRMIRTAIDDSARV